MLEQKVIKIKFAKECHFCTLLRMTKNDRIGTIRPLLFYPPIYFKSGCDNEYFLFECFGFR